MLAVNVPDNTVGTVVVVAGIVVVVVGVAVEIGVLQAPFASEYSNGSVLLTPLVPYPRVDL